MVAGALLEGTEEVPVRVRLSSAERSAPQDLQSLNIILQRSAADGSLQDAKKPLGLDTEHCTVIRPGTILNT